MDRQTDILALIITCIATGLLVLCKALKLNRIILIRLYYQIKTRCKEYKNKGKSKSNTKEGLALL